MSNRSCPSNEPGAAQHVTGDNITEGDLICNECRQMDWDSLPTLAERWAREGQNRRSETIRIIDANHEQLATSSCKICRILSVFIPRSVDADCWVVRATAIRTYDEFSPRKLRGERDEEVIALYARSKANKHIFDSKRLVAMKRDSCSSRMIAPRSIDYDWLKRLTRECEESHGFHCSRSSLDRLPGMKVIDVSSRSIIEAPIGCRYVALSYVWGKQQVESPQMDLQQPPPLIEDAISVTSSMGYEYLWIDRYCISQDDDQERHHMISRMDKVYSSASVTIIDASGEDAHGGLPGVSNYASRFQQPVHIGNTTIMELPLGEHELRASKWATRGWTYQEGYFSRRRLIFTPSQVVFLCAERYEEESMQCLLQEDGPHLSIVPFARLICSSPKVNPRILMDAELADQLVEYSKRELTYPSDSLNAFLGVLNFHTQDPNRPLLHVSWGVFALSTKMGDDLRIFLDWHHKSPAQRRPGFPSWTWAGWGGELQGVGRGITLSRHEEESRRLLCLSWELSSEPKDHTAEDFWAFATHVWSQWSTAKDQLHQRPTYTDRLQVTCVVIPIRFQKVQLTRDQRYRKTTIHFDSGDVERFSSIHFGNHPDTIVDIERAGLNKGNAAVLKIWEGVYVAVEAYLDQELNMQDCIIGLLFAETDWGKRTRTFGCLIARQLDDGLYERVGAIPQVFAYYIWPDLSFDRPLSGPVFLDETGDILDTVRVAGRGKDRPFDDVGERRTIVLV